MTEMTWPGPHQYGSPEHDYLPEPCGPRKYGDPDTTALPPEPDEGSAVRDTHSLVWQLEDGLWFAAVPMPSPLRWPDLFTMRGPLHLLVDGPVIA